MAIINNISNYRKNYNQNYNKNLNYQNKKLQKIKNLINYQNYKKHSKSKTSQYLKKRNLNTQKNKQKQKKTKNPVQNKNKKPLKKNKQKQKKTKKRNLSDFADILDNTSEKINNLEIDPSKIIFDAGILTAIWGVSNYKKKKAEFKLLNKQLVRKLGVVQINKDNLRENNNVLGMALEKLENSKETIEGFREEVGQQLEDTLMKIVEDE